MGMEASLEVESSAEHFEFAAPFAGWVIPLSDVPDPVFSQNMVGEGVAIEPFSPVLRAPFSGKVVQIHTSLHALTLSHMPSGLELLLHIGLDTVQLKGEGFKVAVKKGDWVEVGAPLISFDADFISRKAKSLISPLVFLPSDKKWRFEVKWGQIQAGEKGFIKVFQTAASHKESRKIREKEAFSESAWVQVPTQEGIHARPASLLLQASRRFDAEIYLVWKEQKASCRSLVQLLELAVPGKAPVRFIARGPDAEKAITELVRVTREMVEVETAGKNSERKNSEPNRQNPTPLLTSQESEGKDKYIGVTAAPGMVAGKIVVVRHQDLQPEEKGKGIAFETSALFESLSRVKLELKDLESEMKGRVGSAQAAIFNAHQDILEDPQILSSVEDELNLGCSAAWAVNKVLRKEALRLSQSQNELIAARANDLLDVNRRWVGQLMGKKLALPEIPPNSILVAEDLSPSDTAAFDKSCVLGFCTRRGGMTSHVAILARSLDIPALAAIDPRVLQLENGTSVLLNASEGYLQVQPPADLLFQVQKATVEKLKRREKEDERAQLPAQTLDQHLIKVFANFSNHEEADHALHLGAEGVGLMRSEFLFLNREEAPSEEEQFHIYSHMAHQMGAEHPVIIRTLDVGGDKPLAYCPLPAEDNPFLGERGIRLLLKEQELLRVQVRAILRASQWGSLRIMIPMITNISEVRACRQILIEEAQKLKVSPVPLGIMIEVPAAVLIADQLAREVDFFSIGTNDLTQYVLAMDRNHPALAREVDALHPAVLKMIQWTVAAGDRHHIEVGICGGLAGDEGGIPLLLGLGLKELSVSLPSVPSVKERIRKLNKSQCSLLAEKALQLESAQAVREQVKVWLREMGI